MATETELHLFTRSVGGDYQCRVDLFMKFLLNNTRVRLSGIRYGNMDDFLHDCFTNVLRSSTSFNTEDKLSDWIESVAMRTAMDRDRPRKADNPASKDRVRMCASMEGDDVGEPQPGIAYVPPRNAADYSPASAMSAVVGEPQFALLLKRASETSTLDDAAEAVGIPVNVAGPMLVRTIDRLTRFFGAPPPLNHDLDQIFSEVRVRVSAQRHADPLKPKGRVIPMKFDPAFYTLTPEMRRIGLAVPDEVRTLTLFGAAIASNPPSDPLRGHLSTCHYCADLLRAMFLMHQALQSASSGDFLLCPGAFTLIHSAEQSNEALERHLAECPACSSERAKCLDAEQLKPAQAAFVSGLSRAKLAAVGGALVLALGGAFYASHRSSSAVSAGSVTETQIAFNSRYKDLAQGINLDDDEDLVSSALPQDRDSLRRAMHELRARKVPDAMMLTSQILAKRPDPGAQMLQSIIFYSQQSPAEGYPAMLKAEAMPPRNAFRCWAAMQCALMAGDAKTAEREASHLADDSTYGAMAKALLAKVKARG